MNEKVTQRLIGFLVLIGAIFIILPFLFHNSKPFASSNTSPSTSNPSNTVTTLSLPDATPTSQNTVQPQPIQQAQPPVQPQLQPVQSISANNVAPSTSDPVTAASPAQDNAAPVSQPVSQTSVESTASSAPQTQPSTTMNVLPSQTVSQPTTPSTQSAPSAQPTLQAVTADHETIPTTQVTENKPVHMHAAAHKHTVVHHISTVSYPWIIQLGVFSNAANAKKLLTKLHAHHIKAYSRLVVHGNHTLTAILIPQFNLNQAQHMQQKLHHLVNLKGIVRKN